MRAGRKEVKVKETETLASPLTPPPKPLGCYVWHFPVNMGIYSPVVEGVTIPPLTSGLSLHAETHTIALCWSLWKPRTRGPYEIQWNSFYPLKIQYKSSLVLSQLGMSIYLNGLSPSSCLLELFLQPHPDTLLLLFFLSPPLSQLFFSSPAFPTILCSAAVGGGQQNTGQVMGLVPCTGAQYRVPPVKGFLKPIQGFFLSLAYWPKDKCVHEWLCVYSVVLFWVPLVCSGMYLICLPS